MVGLEEFQDMSNLAWKIWCEAEITFLLLDQAGSLHLIYDRRENSRRLNEATSAPRHRSQWWIR